MCLLLGLQVCVCVCVLLTTSISRRRRDWREATAGLFSSSGMGRSPSRRLLSACARLPSRSSILILSLTVYRATT